VARAVVVLLLAGVALGACGGGERLGPQAYAEHASKICRVATRHARGVDIPAFTRPARAAAAIDALVEEQRGTLAELRDLKPEKERVAALNRWLALLDQMLDEADLVVVQLQGADPTAATESALRVSALEERSAELARKHDITPCRFAALQV
jgi:hypothetical protein